MWLWFRCGKLERKVEGGSKVDAGEAGQEKEMDHGNNTTFGYQFYSIIRLEVFINNSSSSYNPISSQKQHKTTV